MALKLTAAPTTEPLLLAEVKTHMHEDLVDAANDAKITRLIIAARIHAENECRRAFVTQKWDLWLDAFPLHTYYGVLPGYVPVDQLPSAWMTMRNYAVRFRGGRIDLPFPMLQSVDAVKYRAAAAENGTAVAATSSTLTLAVAANATDSYYNGAVVQIVAGAGAGQVNSVISYVGATRQATVGPWDVLPDATSVYALTGVIMTLSPARYTVDAISEPGVITPAVNTYWPDTVNTTNAVQISYTSGYGDATAVPAGIKEWMLMRIGAMYENREEIVVGQRLTLVELPFVDNLLDPYRIRSYV
jgi:hypothetical protein